MQPLPWNPSTELSPQEEQVMKRIRKAKKKSEVRDSIFELLISLHSFVSSLLRGIHPPSPEIKPTG